MAVALGEAHSPARIQSTRSNPALGDDAQGVLSRILRQLQAQLAGRILWGMSDGAPDGGVPAPDGLDSDREDAVLAPDVALSAASSAPALPGLSMQLPRKRPAPELVQQGASSRARCTTDAHENFAAYQQLTGVQRAIIKRVIGMLDTEQDSVVLTNPLQSHSPIVYVTNAWQDMCGYNMAQALGQNPRITQGEGTDPETIRSMGVALANQQACRVRLVNYRGYNHEPFWNCLSVQPIFFNQKLVLFAARLQDYSHRLTRLVSISPAQFCKAGDCLQYRVRLGDRDLLLKPGARAAVRACDRTLTPRGSHPTLTPRGSHPTLTL